MRLYIKKLDNFDYKLIDFNYINNIISQNETKFCRINRDFEEDLFSPFENRITNYSNGYESDKNYKNFFGITNFSNFQEQTLKFAIFKVNNNEPNYFFINGTNDIKIEELENHVSSICLLKIKNNYVVYGSLTSNNSVSKNIDIFISKMFRKEIISNNIPNFNILKEIKDIGVSEIYFNIISNKNYIINDNNNFINIVKHMSNLLFGKSENWSNKKNDLRLRISISSENNKKKEGYNNLEILKSEAIKLINEDDLKDEYIIYLRNGNEIKSSELILSKSIDILYKNTDLKIVADNVFNEMDNFFNERLEDIHECL